MTLNIIESLIISSLLFTLSSCHEGPVIGILTEELLHSLQNQYPNYTSYIAASYVKAIEGSGARVAPILIGQSEAYYRKQISVLNGIVFPGGACLFDNPNGYADAGATIFKIAKEVNKNGDYFPILGVCLGFELLLHLANGGNELRTRCSSENVGLPLKFVPGFRNSRLYGQASIEILSILSSLSVTSNHHRYCITPKNMTRTGLDKEWKILSLNMDKNGLIFVSSIESIDMPFVGIQFHPEKNSYEWKKSQNNPHSRKAVLSARHFYDWIANEASKNEHSYPSESDKTNALIENYSVFYTGKQGASYEEVYLFK
ncbi:gamma-glutamyl hydrolase A-like [Lycorma delicatula]|uniref:gamma-glutamyl hydrolase A-like n=1 Tax=Lycorma delicatula TaxID=130591 RepID=UPI003F50EE16